MGNSVDKSKIIDIHTHILYDIDDGSETIDMSTKLMGMAYDQVLVGNCWSPCSSGKIWIRLRRCCFVPQRREDASHIVIYKSFFNMI